MDILITGSSGLVGSTLTTALEGQGHTVLRLVRREPTRPGEHRWDPGSGHIDEAALDVDAVVHLAGENIAAGRWTKAVKQRIRSSRIDGTSLLARAIAERDEGPSVFVTASAVGFYGNRGDELLDESAEAGEGDLASVCQAWEAACEPATAAGVRVAHLRFGVVLARHGGALQRMLPIFRCGLGGKLGNGRQWMSWIALDDAVSAIQRALTDESLTGPVNAVAPEAVTNARFTAVLGRVLRRPAFLPAPAFALKLVLGEMAEELLLASARVEPRKLLDAGHDFEYRELEPALRALLT